MKKVRSVKTDLITWLLIQLWSFNSDHSVLGCLAKATVWRVVRSYMVPTNHMWLFRFKLTKIKNLVPHLYWPHFRCSKPFVPRDVSMH